MAEELSIQEPETEQTPHSISPHRPPSPDPRKRKDLVGAPSLTNCHSCDRHVPPRSQTLTDLRLLPSHWRIVLLCDDCFRLVRSAFKCSYCFLDLSAAVSRNNFRLLDCGQCSRRIHSDCVPTHQRLISPSSFDPDSFICVDCCPLPRSRGINPRNLFARVSVEDLVMDAKKKAAAAIQAKEKAVEKVRVAKCAAVRAQEALGVVSASEVELPVVKDEELALRLHLAMNGSQRISRSGRGVSLRGKRVNGCSQKVEFCREDKAFLDSWKPVEEEVAANGEMVVKEEEGSYSNKVVHSGVWITYQRVRKSKGVGSREVLLEKKAELGVVSDRGDFWESEQMSKCTGDDRFAKKYTKRKSTLNNASNGKSLGPCWPTSCLKESSFTNAPLSSLPGC